MQKHLVRGLAPGYERKLSEVILEFAGQIVPLDQENPKAFEGAVHLAIALWNVGLLPEDSQGEEIFQLRQKFGFERNVLMSTELDSFLELRKTKYATDHRLAARYHYSWKDKGPHLSVESYDMDRLKGT